ncbi:MAG: hypothetical protein AAFN65_08145, partial [Bacteroidota bacterium]
MSHRFYLGTYLFTILLGCLTLDATAQVGINTDNAAPDSSAMLDVQSSDKGLLIPRMDSTSRRNITNPADGLMVYDSTFGTFWYYENLKWNEIRNGSDSLTSTDLLDSLPAADFSCLGVASSLSLGQEPRSVAISGNYAYVVDSLSNDLKIINVSDPSSPSTVGSVSLGFPGVSIAVSGNYAYAVGGFGGVGILQIVNVNDPTSPSLEGGIGINTGPESILNFLSSVAIVGNYAYL